jgi:chaperonin GroEL
LAKLASGVAVIRVGAVTDLELRERHDRVQDALCATRAAMEQGIVAGGGAALLHAGKALAELKPENDEQKVGIDIVRHALRAPAWQIVASAPLRTGMTERLDEVRLASQSHGLMI